MPRLTTFFFIPVVCALTTLSTAADKPAKSKNVKPIHALLITGGCCHDYAKQKLTLSKGISTRANVVWTIIHQGGSTTNTRIPFYKNKDWAKGYDVVVHNECFAGVTDPKWTAQILKPHKDGLPAVVIHCAMHSYRDKTDQWFKFLGVTSHRHGRHYPYTVKNQTPDHPIMKGFGAEWTTPKGELYLISKFWPTAKSLGHAMSKDTRKMETCIWTNMYGKTRVFGTTIGHHNETMQHPKYLDMVTRGLLWSVNKLNPTYLTPARKPKLDPKTKIKIPLDHARNKPTKAAGSQSGHPTYHAVDGDPSTRWCAPNADFGFWWQVDLQKPTEISSIKINWEFDHARYYYTIQGSLDEKNWTTLADRSRKPGKGDPHLLKFKPFKTRYIKITIHKQNGGWASFYNFSVYGKETTEVYPHQIQTELQTASDKDLRGVKAAPGLNVNMYAAPPQVNYPVVVAAAPTGEVFVGVDENGSLGRDPNRGKIVRCVDTDNDGRADKFTTFAKMDSPRGIVVDGRVVYVQHPPFVTAYYDEDWDGVADKKITLVTGLGFDLKFRGADHTTNGMHMGIDGWLYIAVGDYGFVKATGTDGKSINMRGGGIVRLRPDGSELEIYARGLRNVCDVAVDPLMNLYTRDNTNDGGGWDVRLSHITQNAHFGYPTLYKNFGDEIMPPLADYGGGSGTGALYVDEGAISQPYGNALYTLDWGRSKVFRHPLSPKGATVKAEQTDFLSIPRPTDMDVDANGNMYVGSWKNGRFKFSGVNVGFVVRLSDPKSQTDKFSDPRSLTEPQLLKYLASSSHVRRLAVQREILRRGPKPEITKRLELFARFGRSNLNARVAALFTIKQLLGTTATPILRNLAANPDLRPYVFRALTDRTTQLKNVDPKPFIVALSQNDPRAKTAALISLARLNHKPAIPHILPLAADMDPVIAHTAVKSLVALRAIKSSLSAITQTTALSRAAHRVLRELHDPQTVSGLIALIARTSDPVVRKPMLTTLIRLYHREKYWTGGWWGTRPDTTGPYYTREKWDQSDKIESNLRFIMANTDSQSLQHILRQLQRHRVNLPGTTDLLLATAAKNPSFRNTAAEILAQQRNIPDKAVPLLESIAISSRTPSQKRQAAFAALRRVKGKKGTDAAHRVALALVKSAVSSFEARLALLSYLTDRGHARSIDRFIKLCNSTNTTERELAYAVLMAIANNKRNRQASTRAAAEITTAWKSDSNRTSLLRAAGHVGARAYADKVRTGLKSASPATSSAAEYAAQYLGIPTGKSKGKLIATLKYEKVLAEVLKIKGDPRLGARLFVKQTCSNCHTTKPSELLKGPYLGGIAARYSRSELTESILKPNAIVAQGFTSYYFTMNDNTQHVGFVVSEAGDQINIRTITGQPVSLKKSGIKKRGKLPTSIMPPGLAHTLTTSELASLLAFLESLKSK